MKVRLYLNVLLCSVFVFALVGCQNLFKSEYRGTYGKTENISPLVVDGSNDIKADNAMMRMKGFKKLGWSQVYMPGETRPWRFNSYSSIRSEALDFAKEIKADAVVVYFVDVGSRSMLTSVTVPKQTTSYVQTSGNVYSPNSSYVGSYSGGSTVTTNTYERDYYTTSVVDKIAGATFWVSEKSAK